MKIFVLLSRFPYPLEKGDKLRAFHQIKELSKNHDIILCALSDIKVSQEHVKIIEDYCIKVEVIYLPKNKKYWNLIRQLLFSDKSLQVAYFYNISAHNKIKALIHQYQPEHIYCQYIRVAEYVKGIEIKKTLDYMDALSKGMERRKEVAPFYLKPFMKIEARRLKRYEHSIFDEFNNHTIISEQDRKLLINIKNDFIKIVPNGVDYSEYKNQNLSKEYDLVFTGNMSYSPNIASVVYLIKKVMPLVWEKQPDVNIVIAGATPHFKVVKLQSKKVKVTGWVDNMVEYYAKSRVFIAPMQLGTGLQNKLLEAMAMKLPCITSQLANNALGATHQQNILIGNKPEEYAKHILNLLSNQELYEGIAEKGHLFVKQYYTWEGTTSLLEQSIIES